jgi:hypothetical protein
LSRKIKLLLFSSTVESILFYNSTTWTLTEKVENSINGSYLRLLRCALDINWKDHVPNKDVFQDLRLKSNKVVSRSLNTLRSDQGPPQPVIQILIWEPNTGGKHGKGRKMTCLKRILGDTQREKRYLVDDVRDRKEWRKFVKRLL